MTKQQLINQIQEEITEDKRLPLFAYRTKNGYFPVIGEGNLKADIIFIGEAPGLHEAKTGRPFIGAAGKFLNELLASIKLEREDVYITSVIKDRPPENRDPLPGEIKAYAPFLIRQLEIIKPRVIVPLGRFALNFVFEYFGLKEKLDTIGKIHGQSFKVKAPYGPVTIITLYHPALALYNGSMRPVLKKDFRILKKFV